MLNRNKFVTSQSGFTLVEIAIVLVIIGLLLGGVLKGQELIENAKIRNAISDLNGVSAAYYGYIDRFKRLPGDDGPTQAALTARGGLWATLGAAGFGNNDGVITNLGPATFTGALEGDNFWMQLKAAGLIAGNPADTGVNALPRNAFTGLTGFTNDTTVLGAMPGNKVCMSEVPGKAARAIDTQLDDGLGASGTIRATLGVAGQNTAPLALIAAVYNDGSVYTICRGL